LSLLSNVSMRLTFTLLICLIVYSSYGQDYALDLDGQDDYVELSNFPDVTTNFTITAWIKTEERVYPFQRIFIDDRHESNGDGWGFSLTDFANFGQLSFYSRTTTPQVLYSPAEKRLASGVWYFVTAVADITNHMRHIYINGELVASQAFTGNWGIDTGKASIGGININTPTGMEAAWFNGELDNVTFWNKALTQTEIADVMCSPADPSKPNILGIWRFNEGSGTTTADESGNGYDGTFFSGPYTPVQWVASTLPTDCSVYFPPNLTVGDLQITEGSGGTKNAPIVISLDRSSPVPISILYWTVAENVNNNDFIPVSVWTTIPANTTQLTVNVPIVGDQTDEYSESFLLYVYAESGVDIRDDRGRCIILDDDIPPGVRVNDTMATENSGQARVRISLTRPSAKTARVRFNTNNQTALARYDYLSQYQGSIVFAPGETSKYINIVLLNDAVSEPTENFRFILYAPENLRDDEASGGKTIGFVSILDNDNSAAANSGSIELKQDLNMVMQVRATPNPSSNEFTLSVVGSDQKPATLRVTDMLGRIVEARSGIRTGAVQRIGAAWRPGIYFAEIVQGNNKRTIRLVKTD
jgi:hypothetical protein